MKNILGCILSCLLFNWNAHAEESHFIKDLSFYRYSSMVTDHTRNKIYISEGLSRGTINEPARGRLTVLDTPSEQFTQFNLPGDPLDMSISPDGTTLAVALGENGIYLRDLTGREDVKQSQRMTTFNAYSAAFDKHGNLFVSTRKPFDASVFSNSGPILFLSREHDFRPIELISDSLSALVRSASSGNEIFIVSMDGEISRIDTSEITPRLLEQKKFFGRGEVIDYALSPLGDRLYLARASADGIHVIDLRDSMSLAYKESGQVAGVAVAPSGSGVYVLSDSLRANYINQYNLLNNRIGNTIAGLFEVPNQAGTTRTRIRGLAIDSLGTKAFAVRGGYGDSRGSIEVHILPPLLQDPPKIGDVNFDGKFDSADLAFVFTKSRYLTGLYARWIDGDWNRDQQFDEKDLVIAFQEGDYQQ